MNLEKLIKEATEINPLEVMGRIEKLKKTKATDALSQQMIDMAVEELTGSIQKKALVDAVLNKDYSTLVKHRDMLGERGKDALLEMLEGEDIGKLYTLNKESGERFMKTRKPIDKGHTLSDVEMDEIIKNRGRLNSAIDDIGLEDNISAELEGMGPMDKGAFGNVIKDRLQADRFKRNQNVDMSIDEMFNNDFISNKDIENSPRFDKWKREERDRIKRHDDYLEDMREGERYFTTKETDIDDDFIQAALELDINPREIDSKYKAANTLHTKAKEAHEMGDYSREAFLEDKARSMIDEAAALDEQVTEQMGKKRSDYEYLFEEPTRIDEVNRGYFDPTEKTGGNQLMSKEIQKRRRGLYDAAKNTPEEKRIPLYREGKWYKTKAKDALRKMYQETRRK